MKKDDLHLIRMVSGSGLLPDLSAGTLAAPKALTAEAAGAIYGKVARFGFSSFQMVQGGAQLAAADGSSILMLTGTGWQLQEALEKTAFRLALDKQSAALKEYLHSLPGSRFIGHTIEIAALWENVKPAPVEYIASRFLKDQAAQLVENMEGLTYNGGAIRLSLSRVSTDEMPAGIGFMQQPTESFDFRIEPYFADKSKMWVQLNAVMPVPTGDVSVIEQRTELCQKLLWEDLADRLSLGA